MNGFNKKGIHVAAFAINLLIAVPIIAVSFLLLFGWMGTTGVSKQQSVIKGDIGTVKIDKILSNWAFSNPDELLSVPDELEEFFKQQFLGTGLVLDAVSCAKENIVTCEFSMRTGKSPQFVRDFNRYVRLPKDGSLHEIRFTGRLLYE